MPSATEKKVLKQQDQTPLEREATAFQNTPLRLKQPVGLIGPGDGGIHLCDAAFIIAQRLARCGLAIVCGGRGGVMEAASRGASEGGGTVIGLLPEDDDRAANPYLTVAIPTGLGEMRNALIARSSLCLVAVGGGMGTVSEMAFGLKLGKPVFCLYPDFNLPGTSIAVDINDIVASVLSWVVQRQNSNAAATIGQD